MLDLVKLVIVFILVISLTRKYPLGISLLIGSLFLGFIFWFETSVWQNLFLSTLTNYSLWNLFFIFIAIGLFASAMEVSGALDEMIRNLQEIVNNKKVIIALTPMLIGMVNLPGGAYISAPFVDKAANGFQFSQEDKSSINIIFRHFWYPVYPIFPAIILLHDLSGVPINKIILLGIPSVLISFFMSWWICFRGIPYKYNDNKRSKTRFIFLGNFIRALLPLLIIVFLVIVIRLNILMAILIGILTVVLLYYKKFFKSFDSFKKMIVRIFKNGIKWRILIIPFGIYFFRNALDRSEVIEMLPGLISNMNISILIPTVIFSALVAFFTAYHLAAISISAPVILPLLPAESYDIGVFLLLIGTLLGYLISPLHTCIALSNDYFKADYIKTAGKILVSGIGILIGAIISVWVMK